MATEKRINDGLALQNAINGDEELARMIAEKCQVEVYRAGDILMTQGEFEDDVFFILRGRVKCLVDNNLVAERVAGQHVGEMAAIDPRAARSATVIAEEHTETAILSQENLVVIAREKPALWRNFAQELAMRARTSSAGEMRKEVKAREVRKWILFFTLLSVFLATVSVTLLGIIDMVKIPDFYLKGLYFAVILEIVTCVVALFKRSDFV